MSATRSALVDTGEQRSPKYTPESIAPPTSRISTFMAAPMVPQMTPMVAAVPKEVPVSTDTRQFRRNVMRIRMDGRISTDAQQTMTGVVLEDFYREEIVLVMTRSLAQKMQLTDQLFPESGFSILKDVPFILGREDDIGACFCPRNLMEGTLSAGDAASLLVVPTGPEGENMIHFGYVKKNYQWSVIEAFIRCAREPEAVRR